MSVINHTRIARIVNAVFSDGDLPSKLKGMASPVPYELGLFAEQDYRAGVSAIYTLRSMIIRLMDVEALLKPLQDQPAEGSLESNDLGTESDTDIERREALKEALYAHSVIERHLESLAKQARNDLEEAGSKTADGGRLRFNLKTKQFQAYCGSFEDFIKDAFVSAKPGTRWYYQLDAAKSLTFPFVSAQEAADMYSSYFEDEALVKVSSKAWDKVMDSLEAMGQDIADHESLLMQYNALDKEHQTAGAKSDLAVACKEYKQTMRNHEYWVNRFLSPWALLMHLGAPAELLNSPEWRTKEAEIRTRAARAQMADVQATITETQAGMAEMEANMALMQMRKQMAEMQAAMNDQMKAFKAFMAPPKAEKPAAKEKAKPVKAVKPKAKVNGKEKTIMKVAKVSSHTTRDRAGSAAGPRG